ncbi:MAG: hypothetical protein NTV81_01010 [Candidatus Komeilibacteria bacterium]|nr:hypothetical protein [Candidatus Komeilibacteria bacterium]
MDTALIAMVSQVTERLLPIGVAEPRVYTQFLKVFDFIEKSTDFSSKRFVVLKYFWQTLDSLGYLLTQPQKWDNTISASAEKLRQHCLSLENTPITCLTQDLVELEQFTFSYIRYIIEDDIPSFHWYLWQQQQK